MIFTICLAQYVLICTFHVPISVKEASEVKAIIISLGEVENYSYLLTKSIGWLFKKFVFITEITFFRLTLLNGFSSIATKTSTLKKNFIDFRITN